MENSFAAFGYFPVRTLAAVVFVVNALGGTALADSTSVEPPRPRSDNVRPAYPHPHGLVTHAPATVTLRFVVDADGSVVDPEVVDGPNPFASAALRAVRSWKYEPARQDGHAISMAWETRVRFELPSKRRDRWSVFRRERHGFGALVTSAAAASAAPASPRSAALAGE